MLNIEKEVLKLVLQAKYNGIEGKFNNHIKAAHAGIKDYNQAIFYDKSESLNSKSSRKMN